jgi:SAM-dependent methyltransferase
LKPRRLRRGGSHCEFFLRETRGERLVGGLELGCGDGTMSYILAGGMLTGWDTFMEMAHLDQYSAGADIHNKAPTLKLNLDNTHLRVNYALGVDLKPTLVQKALRFSKLYDDGLAQDLNRPLEIDRQFPFLFSNILYWLDDLDSSLKNFAGALTVGGHAFFFVPNFNFKKKNWLYYSAPHEPPRDYLNFFDRGYAKLIHHCYTASEWERKFARAGLKVRSHIPYMSSRVTDVWNIGTRPIAPLLISMTQRLSASDREQVKQEWVKFFNQFFAPIIEAELNENFSSDDSYAFHFFNLEKV